jgi:putative ABC transport system permease protein
LNYRDTLSYSVRGITETKFRFLLNLLGIVIGCMAITGLISITEGLNNNINDQLGTLGTNTITVTPERTQGPQAQFQTGSELDYRDVTEISKIPNVALVSPTISGKIGVYTVKGNTYSSFMSGIDENFFIINESIELEKGREIQRNDKAVAVIGSNIVYPDGESKLFEVGDRIRLQANNDEGDVQINLRIIGIMKESGGTFFADPDNSIYIPLRTFEQIYGTGGKYSSIQVLAESQSSVTNIALAIEENIEGTSVITAETLMETVGMILNSVQAVLGGIAAISLIVAGVGIINTMTISVLERTHEIGVLKAVGAKNYDIIITFLVEASITGFIGGLIGSVSGFLLSNLVGSYVGIDAVVSIKLGALVVFFAVVTSTLSGVYPAWRASNLNPVDALRNE